MLWHLECAIHLLNIFFSIPIRWIKNNLHLHEKRSERHMFSCFWLLILPDLCLNKACRDLYHLDILQNIMLVNYVDGIVLIRPGSRRWQVIQKYSRSIRKLHAFERLGNKPHEDSRTSHNNEVRSLEDHPYYFPLIK